MKVLHYCQHVLGVGHFFRSLEIARALDGHEVVMVTGGPEIEAGLPEHMRRIRLPGLKMDAGFTEISVEDEGRTLDEIKALRRSLLLEIFDEESPDCFLIELYPFGRKAFRFELGPVLEGIRAGLLPPCPVICSLRDILVEKENQAEYEARVVGQLNSFFSALLVHADPALVGLDQTFSSLDKLHVPVIHTGFVAPKPSPEAGLRLRRELGLADKDRLIVASAGGGKVGAPLLRAVAEAFSLMNELENARLHIYTGPFMDDSDYESLSAQESGRLRVHRFSPHFVDLLSAADLSISMAGYNTCMNVVSAGVRALVWPFGQNREQRLRAERLASLGALKVLDDGDLAAPVLAGHIYRALESPRPAPGLIDMDGARNTAAWLENFVESNSL